jgi:K(+)-stimulated pyrophosphate-energized sodium pump
MSVGLLLVAIELFFMICILQVPALGACRPCFIGFAIGESLGASALRICGGIFTKIADIGADLMKIVFNLPEDDPRNPGVIADCTGDNAGDSVGPTADGFETYGVTGVALIAFLALALAAEPGPLRHAHRLALRDAHPDGPDLPAQLFRQSAVSSRAVRHKKDFNLEQPLTSLVWITSLSRSP